MVTPHPVRAPLIFPPSALGWKPPAAESCYSRDECRGGVGARAGTGSGESPAAEGPKEVSHNYVSSNRQHPVLTSLHQLWNKRSRKVPEDSNPKPGSKPTWNIHLQAVAASRLLAVAASRLLIDPVLKSKKTSH